MSDLGDYPNQIRDQMQKAEKDYQTFIDVLMMKKPEPYVDLALVEVVISMVLTSNSLNQLRYSEVEMNHKVRQYDAEKAANKTPTSRATGAKGKINNDAEKTLMVLKIYELTQYHRKAQGSWTRQVRDMIVRGERKKWPVAQKGFWQKFLGESKAALERMA